jgi:RNA polymerase sigma-70 factor (ECF subfamily)
VLPPKPPPKVDSVLLARAQRGDRDAHSELYALFGSVVFTLARRMLASRAAAEDVLQDTFIEVFRKIGTYRGEADLGFWVKRIAINKCLMYLRSGWMSRRCVDGEDILSEAPARSAAVDEQIALERALDALPHMARAVVWLHDVEGHTHKEIGAMLGYTASFSKSQLARAHERLRVLLESGEEESESDLCAPVLKTC